MYPRDPYGGGQSSAEHSTGYRAPIANMIEPEYRAPTANMVEPPYRAPIANMIEPTYRAPIANMVELPYRAPTARMYPYEPHGDKQSLAERSTSYRAPSANKGETPYRAPTAHMFPYEQSDPDPNTYGGRERPVAPIAHMYPRADGPAAGHYRHSERQRDGYSSRERLSLGTVGTSGGRREPSQGSHSYERSGDRYGERYRDRLAEQYSTYRG